MAATISAYRIIVVNETGRVIITDDESSNIFIKDHQEEWLRVGKTSLEVMTPDLESALDAVATSMRKVNELLGDSHEGS